MSVHFNKNVEQKARYDRREGHEAARQYVNRPTRQNLADVLAETEKGKVLIAEAKARAEAERAEQEAAQRAHDEAVSKARAEMEAKVDSLMVLACDVFGKQLGQWKLFERACAQRRFHALASGTMLDKIEQSLRHASYSSMAYVMAYEYLTGDECKFVPPAVYRNAKQVK
jgi:hypothetical protein